MVSLTPIGQEIGQINLPDDYPEAEYKDVQVSGSQIERTVIEL